MALKRLSQAQAMYTVMPQDHQFRMTLCGYQHTVSRYIACCYLVLPRV